MTRRLRPSASALLLIVLVFQVSILFDIVGLHSVGRVVNGAVLVVFFVSAVTVDYRKVPAEVFLFFVLPAAFVLGGYGMNVIRSLSPDTLGYMGMLLPWLAVVSVPFMKSYSLEKSWKVFFWFMLVTSAVSCIEYYAVFTGKLQTKTISTVYGTFVTGIFTSYTMLPDGSPYYRMQGIFPEPGTLGMWVLPAIAYALVQRQWLALAVFAVTLYLCQSLGAFVSVIVVIGLFVWWRTQRWVPRALILSAMGAAIVYFVFGALLAIYETKGASATVRIDNVSFFLGGLWQQMVAHPFGAPLIGSSLTTVGAVDQSYLGSNFAPYTALILGGAAAMIGYVAFIVIALTASAKFFLTRRRDPLYAAAFISLPALALFVFQRVTVLDSPVFAFLIAAPVIAMIRSPAPAPLKGTAPAAAGPIAMPQSPPASASSAG